MIEGDDMTKSELAKLTIEKLTGIIQNENIAPRVRVMAAEVLLQWVEVEDAAKWGV